VSDETEILLAIKLCRLAGFNPFEEANVLEACRDEPGVPHVEFKPRWQGYRWLARQYIMVHQFLNLNS
jgi:hypothetical protein